MRRVMLSWSRERANAYQASTVARPKGDSSSRLPSSKAVATISPIRTGRSPAIIAWAVRSHQCRDLGSSTLQLVQQSSDNNPATLYKKGLNTALNVSPMTSGGYIETETIGSSGSGAERGAGGSHSDAAAREPASSGSAAPDGATSAGARCPARCTRRWPDRSRGIASFKSSRND